MRSLAAEQLRDNARIDRGPTVPDAANRIDELAQICETILEQVANMIRALTKEIEGVMTLDILGEQEYAHFRVLAPDPFGCYKPFVRLGRRHPNVMDDERGRLLGHEPVQFFGVGRLADDFEARAFEDPGQPLPKQHGVISDDYSQGTSA